MSGNILEWTSTLYSNYPYDADDGCNLYAIDSQLRVLRGGSFDNTQAFLNATFRFSGSPGYLDDTKGFRGARPYHDSAGQTP